MFMTGPLRPRSSPNIGYLRQTAGWSQGFSSVRGQPAPLELSSNESAPPHIAAATRAFSRFGIATSLFYTQFVPSCAALE
jgi:hypothetical protein